MTEPLVARVLANAWYVLIVLALTTRTAVAAGRHAPAISVDKWLNTAPLRLADLHDRVVLLEFWTFGCHNCQHVEPYIKNWHAKYAADGLVIIAVHSPEFDYEREPANVERYVREHQITYPVAIDNAFTTWQRYDNSAWPSIYVIDKRGMIRYSYVGEGAYQETEHVLQQLLEEPSPSP